MATKEKTDKTFPLELENSQDFIAKIQAYTPLNMEHKTNKKEKEPTSEDSEMAVAWCDFIMGKIGTSNHRNVFAGIKCLLGAHDRALRRLKAVADESTALEKITWQWKETELKAFLLNDGTVKEMFLKENVLPTLKIVSNWECVGDEVAEKAKNSITTRLDEMFAFNKTHEGILNEISAQIQEKGEIEHDLAGNEKCR